MKKYSRNCPKCGKILYSNSKSYIQLAKAQNKNCASCANKGENNPFFGKKHTDEHKIYISSIQYNERYKKGREIVSKKLKGRNKTEEHKSNLTKSLISYYSNNEVFNKGKSFEELYGLGRANELKKILSLKSKNWYNQYRNTDEYKRWESKKDEYELYRLEVERITKLADITTIENYSLKNKYHKYELDHIFPIRKGFTYGIPAELIGHIDNLRIIPMSENRSKSDKIIDDIIPKIIKKFINETKNYQYK